MISPDIEIGKILGAPGSSFGFYSALSAIIRFREAQELQDSTQAYVPSLQELELEIQSEQDELASRLIQSPPEAEVLFDAMTHNSIALDNVRSR